LLFENNINRFKPSTIKAEMPTSKTWIWKSAKYSCFPYWSTYI